MVIKQNFLPIGPARPGAPLDKVLAIVLHWPAAPGQRAQITRDYWAGKDNKEGSSAHCIIDQDGTIIQAIPWNEKAFHVGSVLKDPASGQIYTDLARQMFGAYASNPATMSPNRVTIGIEMETTAVSRAEAIEADDEAARADEAGDKAAVAAARAKAATIRAEANRIDALGAYTPETVAAAVELCAQLCQRYALDPATQIIRHIDVVGWKRCPAWYIDHPEDLDAFRAAVAERMSA